MSFSQFKTIDLLIFSIVAVIFEVINRFIFVSLPFFKLIFMSFTIVLALIAMYRWGASGVIVCIFAKLIQTAISNHNNDYRFYISYIVGTSLAVLLGYLLFQKLIGKKRIKNNFLLIPYLLFDFAISMILISLIFSLFKVDNFANSMKGLLVQESMSIFFSIIILAVANRKNGHIFIEMEQYVKEVHELKKLGGLKEMKESPKFNSDSPYTEFDQIDNSTILDGGTMDVDQLKELDKMFENCDKIKVDNPIDCLAKQDKKDKNV